MAIPIYNPQVAPPHKPSRRGIAGAEARAQSQLAAGVEQIGFQFAGRLFDLANNNQVNDAVVKARDRWRSFSSDLERDPDYASYGQKFDSFFSGLREELQGGLKLPRARREIETQLKNLRQDWTETIGKISDSRTIEHARTVRLQGINQAIRDRDRERLLSELRQSKEAREFVDSDLVKLMETGISELMEGQALDYARLLGDQGPAWLLSDEARDKFAMELESGERYFLTPERRNQLATQAANELANRRKAEELADWSRKSAVLSFAQEEIAAGRLTSMDQLEGGDLQEQFRQKHGRDMGFTPDDRTKVEQILATRAEAAEKDREAYSNDLLKTVEDALKAGDKDLAQRYLQELVDGGYAVDRMGRVDPDVRRYSEQLQRLQTGGEVGDFDREANRLWGRLRDRRLAGMREELAGFLKKFPSKEGREEHQQLFNELQQAEAQAEARAAKSTGKSAAELQLEYYRYFSGIMDNPEVSADEVRRVDQWRWRNYPQNERNKALPGIEEETFQLMGSRIKAKQEELAKGTDLRTRELKMAEERIRVFYDPQIKELEGNRKKGPTEQMYRLMSERDRMLLALQEGAKNEKIDLMQQSMTLLSGLKTRRVKDLLKTLAVPEPRAPAAAPVQQTEKQLRQNFRELKGREPADSAMVDGKPAFSDGRYWWIFDEGAWRFWDGEKWVIESKSLLK